MPFEIVPENGYGIQKNRKGGPQLVYKNHFYNIRHHIKKKYNGKYWVCSMRTINNCRVGVIRENNGRLIIKGVHNHLPKKGEYPKVIQPHEYTMKINPVCGVWQIHHNGYLYNVYVHHGRYRVACSSRPLTKCSITFSIQQDGSFILFGPHNHEPMKAEPKDENEKSNDENEKSCDENERSCDENEKSSDENENSSDENENSNDEN